jgi:hypothetical protein
MAWDAVATAIPFVPGSYAAKGIKAIADNAVDVSKSGNSIIEATSSNNLQKMVEKGQAPRGVDRVDKPHVPGQKPHVHFKDGTSFNNDGSLHDAHKGIPNLSNTIKKWLENNGWKAGE